MHVNFQDEHFSFQQMANNMLESKDKEITHLLEQIGDMQKVIDTSKVGLLLKFIYLVLLYSA